MMGVDIAALMQLSEAKAMPLEDLIKAIEAGIYTAYAETPQPLRYARVHLDRESGEIKILVPTFNELGERLSEEVTSPSFFVTFNNRSIFLAKCRGFVNGLSTPGDVTSRVNGASPMNSAVSSSSEMARDTAVT